jgi:serine/threonine protein kinase/tetratricopeptide (TPR) repeat protein
VILCDQCGTPHGEEDRFCPSCGAAAESGNVASKDPLVGRTIGGSYVILELVGVGGMGRVYRAEQRMLGRTVAIKVVHPHLLSDEQSVARFYTEARAASRLNHPNSVSIIDFGRSDDGILYLAMEFLHGKDLARLMREDGPLPLARICEILSSVLEALAEAHALGVVHRDLKPENVIIERLKAGRDLVKVVDFGLAKLLSGQQGRPSITLPGLVCGTPDYMSPEQGRGEEVDARGDIYSVGVMLFELLTERLPFIADTPTNVVLKHIQDPVPDPREIAPKRQISESLVQVLMQALAKNINVRYQRAEEMASALRRVSAELSPGTFEIICTACGCRSPMSKRFCAECGAPLQTHHTPSPRASLPPRMTIARTQRPLLIGRSKEVDSVEALRQAAQGRFISVNVVGETGVGRTRLLAELAERASQAGDIVVGAGPHDSGAPVAYHPIRILLQALLNGDDATISLLAEREARDQPLVAAGLREVITPTGVLGATRESKVGAVACALAHCIHKAQLRAAGKRIVLVIDDLHRCDGLSPRALAELPRYTGSDSVLLIAASGKARPVPLPEDTTVIQLRGFSALEAKAFTTGTAVPDQTEPEPSDRLLVPLYLEQLQGLGLSSDGNGQALPSRLADAVAQRIQRLNVATRRLLQAIAVLGRSANRSSVEHVAEHENMASLPQLLARGLVVETGGALEIIHPLVRDLVEASTPAEARKTLHLRALELATRTDAPLEVRAHHAYGSGETLSALVLLERLGDVSAGRGDLDTAVLGYQRGIELARREVLESGDTSLDDVLASLGRRLGVVLSRRGDVAGSEGVLREALEHSSASGPQRAPILVALARAVSQRSREREAYRLLGQALELAYRDDAVLIQADVQVALAELRRKENNVKSAISALKAVVELLTEQGADATRCVAIYLELAEAQLEDRDWAAAEATLIKARGPLEETGLPYTRARACGLRARVHAGLGENNRAIALFREASALAAFAGAAELVGALERAARELVAGAVANRSVDPARNAVS